MILSIHSIKAGSLNTPWHCFTEPAEKPLLRKYHIDKTGKIISYSSVSKSTSAGDSLALIYAVRSLNSFVQRRRPYQLCQH